MRNRIKKFLVQYLKKDFSKEDLKQKLNSENIPFKKFNKYIISLLKKNTKKHSYISIYNPSRSLSLQTNEFLDKDFIKQIKEKNKDRIMFKCENMHKLSKEELKAKISLDPKLNQFFLIRKNSVYDIDEINRRIMRVCIEFGLTLNDYFIGNLIYDEIVFYVKNLITSCIENGKVNEDELKKRIKEKFEILRCYKKHFLNSHNETEKECNFKK